MGRRTDIDWEAIERDFRAGQLSVREIGVKHKVAASSITRAADRAEAAGHPWSRDLTDRVQARTNEKLLQASLPQSAQRNAANATLRAQQRAQQADIAVEESSNVNVLIVLGERKTIGKARGIGDALMIELEDGAKATPKGKKAPLEKRVAMFKSLAEATRVLVGLERQAFNIKDGGQDLSDPLTALIAELMKRKSVVPIAEEVSE